MILSTISEIYDIAGCSNILRIAGIYDSQNNSFEILENGAFHNLHENDYINGKIRFGIQKFDNKIVCYISTINLQKGKKLISKIKNLYPDINIDFYELEILDPETWESFFIKIDEKGKQIFENKNIQHFDSKSIEKMMLEN